MLPGNYADSGVLDSELRPELTVDEALALGRRAILAAAHRDAFSGGSINCIQPQVATYSDVQCTMLLKMDGSLLGMKMLVI